MAKTKTKTKKTKKSETKKSEITLKALLEAGCHFGHQTRRWNPKMKPYLYDQRDGVHIFDLVRTKECLVAACEFVKKVAQEGKRIVFVGTKRQARAVIEGVAEKIGVPYVNERWIGGTLTNWEQIKKNLDKLAEMKKAKEKGEYKKYTKKEQILLDKEISRLERFYGGLVGLEEVPEVLFVVDVKKEATAAKEAKKKGVTVIGLVDSDSDPDLADWVIPANDDAVGSIKFITEKIGEAVAEGKSLFEKKNKK
jgi:small subunit ribosomal protein S2